jgi:hypothetical protein
MQADHVLRPATTAHNIGPYPDTPPTGAKDAGQPEESQVCAGPAAEVFERLWAPDFRRCPPA